MTLNEREFIKALEAIRNRDTQGEEFAAIIDQMISMLDGGDMDDAFGTEGWRHNVGFD